MIIKIIITLFALFAMSRAYLRYREGSVKLTGLSIWSLIWAAVMFFAWWPAFSEVVANTVGVGRGVDALLYISIIALFYGVFRIYVKLEFIEHELTSLVRNLALKQQHNDEHEKQTTHRTD